VKRQPREASDMTRVAYRDIAGLPVDLRAAMRDEPRKVVRRSRSYLGAEARRVTPGKALETLWGARRARERVESRIVAAVNTARGVGVSWARIGRALGVSGQAAWKRYGRSP